MMMGQHWLGITKPKKAYRLTQTPLISFYNFLKKI